MSIYSNGIFNLDNDEAWYLGEMTTSHCNSLVVDECLQLTPDDINNDFNPEIRLAKPEPKTQSMSRAIPKRVDITKLVRNFAYRPADIIKHTLRHTTQLATSVISFPLRRHFMSRFRFLRKRRLKETIATDTYFSKIKSLEGYWCAQVFFGVESKMIKVKGMKSESDFPAAYLDFIRKHGIPPVLHRDNAKAEMSEKVTEINRNLIIADTWTEPHSPWQNPAELNAVKFLKNQCQVLLDRTGAPEDLWFLAQQYIADVHYVSAHPLLNWLTPAHVVGGDTPDISHILMFYFYQPVWYLDPTTSFPESKEKKGRFVGFAPNVGDILTFKILTDDTRHVIYRSVVRPANDKSKDNKRVSFLEDVKTNLKLNSDEEEETLLNHEIRNSSFDDCKVVDEIEDENAGIQTRSMTRKQVEKSR